MARLQRIDRVTRGSWLIYLPEDIIIQAGLAKGDDLTVRCDERGNIILEAQR